MLNIELIVISETLEMEKKKKKKIKKIKKSFFF